jgi:hypothetical protein
MMYAIEMASCSMIYLPSFMKICIGVQAILRFCLRNLRGCDGITDGRDFLIMPLRWAQVSCDMRTSFIKIGSGIQKLIGGDTQTHTDSKVIL